MPSWFHIRARLSIAALFFLSSGIEANPLPYCSYPGLSEEHCSYPLEDITVVKPGEFVVAKLQCYGCPTTARLGLGHKITHEENALFFNISLSSDRTKLLLNSDPVFPFLSSRSKSLYAPQVPLNLSLSSFSSTIECIQKPCRDLSGSCDCVAGAIGAMLLSYDYAALPSPETNAAVRAWTVQLDALGGHNGYLADPYVEFNSPKQKVLQIHIQQYTQGLLEIMNTTTLIERTHPSGAIIQELSYWEKILKFFGSESDKGRQPGHVIYLLPEWDSYGRVGTLKQLLRRIWGEWPWVLIIVISGSVLVGSALLYAIFKFVVLVSKSSPDNGMQDTGRVHDESGKWSERERLLDEDGDESAA